MTVTLEHTDGQADKAESTIEQTLVILKPDAIQRGIVGEILSRFERAGFKIVAFKMVQPNREHYAAHYEGIGTLKSRKGDEVFESQLDNMMRGPVMPLVLEGVAAIARIRKMVGDTEPSSALPGTIRGDFSHITYDHANQTGTSISNLVHASADKSEATQEIDLWFEPEELLTDYQTVHEPFTQPRK